MAGAGLRFVVMAILSVAMMFIGACGGCLKVWFGVGIATIKVVLDEDASDGFLRQDAEREPENDSEGSLAGRHRLLGSLLLTIIYNRRAVNPLGAGYC